MIIFCHMTSKSKRNINININNDLVILPSHDKLYLKVINISQDIRQISR